MKCPKCNYLGFETGDRCKNCGYDFSLILNPSEPDDIDLDLTLRASDDNRPVSVRSDDEFDGALGASPLSTDIAAVARPVLAASTARPERIDSKLPLFASAFDVAGDAPLIKIAGDTTSAAGRAPDAQYAEAAAGPEAIATDRRSAVAGVRGRTGCGAVWRVAWRRCARAPPHASHYLCGNRLTQR